LQATGVHATLYRAVVEEAVNDGQTIMEALIRAARRALHDQEASARTLRERQGLVESRQYLNKYEPVMVERYPKVLRAAFAASDSQAAALASASVHFDQLELMDEAQMLERVELARAEQVVMVAVELSLAEFNPMMCAAAGLSTVRADRNPVRPEIYVRALQTVMKQIQLSAAVRADLMWHMSEALGKTLAAFYARMSTQLRAQGVQPAGYAVRQTTMHASRKRRTSAPRDESLLTLDKLRKLLSGELERVDARSGPESFAEQFSREFEDLARDSEPASSDFHATVPAAFEVLQEMRQVEQVIERIGTRKAAAIEAPAPVSGSLNAARSSLRHSARGLGQSLSLEVVTLMVDNIAIDERLLGPVQDVIRSLEPALLRLALVDPRFFSDKQHPARRLLQEITDRSLAYESVDTRGFSGFLEPLQRAVGSMGGMQIEDAEPFEQMLQGMVQVWDERKQHGQLESAVKALAHAEQRNLLAEEIARELAARPDAQNIPQGVLEFLCGPWAQVIAHARMADGSGSADPGQYRELVLALFWSVQPELTRKNIVRLTRLVPKLLGKLREGLELIDFPSLKTSAFFELLMNLHQQAFRPPVMAEAAPPADGGRSGLFETADSWVAPAEAEASGFMEMPAALVQDATRLTKAIDESTVAPADDALPVGAWVELLVKGEWIRTQLSWASPHGTLFLFTSATGNTQSMTRRSRNKLLATDAMRIVSGQAVVDGALDAVAQTAMRNSMDIKL